MSSVFSELVYFTPPSMNVRVDYYRLNDGPLVPYVYSGGIGKVKRQAVVLKGDWGVLQGCVADMEREIEDAIEGIIRRHCEASKGQTGKEG